MRPRPARIGSAALAGLVVLLALVVLAGLGPGLGPPPAGAHGGVGTMGLEVTPGPEPQSARVRVLLEYAGDRHLATGAVVTAAATGPAGAALAPTPVPEVAEGRYTTVVALPAPGTWTVTVTAADPAATARAEVTVIDAATAPATGPATTPTRSTDGGSDRAAARRDDGGDPAGSGPGLGLAVAAAAVVLVGVGLLAARARRRPRAG